MDINKGLLFLDGVAYNAGAKILDLGFNGDFDYKNHCWNRLFAAFPAAGANGNAFTLKVYACDAEFSASKTYAVGDVVVKDGVMYLCHTSVGSAGSWSGTTNWIAVSGYAPYSTSATYAVGDLCVKDGVVYRCTTAITVAESWTSGHWSALESDGSLASLTVPAANSKAGGAYAFNMPVGLKRYVTVAIAVGSYYPAKFTVGITNDVDTDCVALAGGVDWTYYKASTLGTALKGTPMQNVAEVIREGVATEAEAAEIAEDAADAAVDAYAAEAAAAAEGGSGSGSGTGG